MTKTPSEPVMGACGHRVNANGNCFTPGCWNHNAKRHEDGRGDNVSPP